MFNYAYVTHRWKLCIELMSNWDHVLIPETLQIPFQGQHWQPKTYLGSIMELILRSSFWLVTIFTGEPKIPENNVNEHCFSFFFVN